MCNTWAVSGAKGHASVVADARMPYRVLVAAVTKELVYTTFGVSGYAHALSLAQPRGIGRVRAISSAGVYTSCGGRLVILRSDGRVSSVPHHALRPAIRTQYPDWGGQIPHMEAPHLSPRRWCAVLT